jgi:hypothetical protein
MQEAKLVSDFVADLAFATVKTVQLKDQGPPVRGQHVSIGTPLVLMSGELVEGGEIVREFSNESTEVKNLLKLMRETTREDGAWMCPPLYRDRLLFVDGQNEVVSALNICFSCNHLRDGLGNTYTCDEASFTGLAELFKSFGHLVHREG